MMNLDRMMIKFAGCFLAGIILGRYLHLSMTFGVLLACSCLILGCLLPSNKWRSVGYGVTLALGIVTLSWAYLPQMEWQRYENQIVMVQGQVVHSPADKFYFIMEPSLINGRQAYSQGRLLIQKPFEDETICQPGQQVLVQGLLRAPLPRTNPGGFSEADYWATQGIFHQVKAQAPAIIIGESQGLMRMSTQIRTYIEYQLMTYLDDEQRQLVMALLLGEKGALDSDFYSMSQKLGIAHVFAVSGLHIGFVVALLLGILRWARLDKSWIAVVIMLGILGMYCILTAFTPSAVRASIMAVMALLAYRWLRFKDVYTIMAIAAMVILVANPLAFWSIGFQLSFVTTWGLIYFYPLAKKLWQWIPWPWLVNGLAVATAAQMASLPLVAYHFYMLAAFAPLFNLWVVPIIGIIVPLLLLALMLSLCLPFLAELLFNMSEGLLVILQWALSLGSHWLGSGHFYLGQPSLWAVAGYFVVLIFLREKGLGLGKVMGRVQWGIWAIVVVMLFWAWQPAAPDNDQVVFLDVGQGSSAVVRTKEGQTLVFDCGNTTNEPANYLKYCGVNTIDGVVISHGDTDHLKGLAVLLRDFRIKQLIIQQGDMHNEIMQPLIALAHSKGTTIVGVEQVEQWQIGQEGLLIVQQFGQKSEQNNSQGNVSMVRLKEGTIVFPGDLDGQSIGQLTKDVGHVDIWTVPHHGSKTSFYAELYQQMVPTFAVISAGRDNRYGHPHEQVTQALKAANIAYGQTNDHGALIIDIEAEKITVRQFLHKKTLEFEK